MALSSEARDFSTDILRTKLKEFVSAGFGNSSEASHLRDVIEHLDNVLVFRSNDEFKRPVALLNCGHKIVIDGAVPKIGQSVVCTPCKKESPFAGREWVHVAMVERMTREEFESVDAPRELRPVA